MNRAAFASACLVGMLTIGLMGAGTSSSGSIYVQATEPPLAGLGLGYFWYDTSAGSLKLATSLSPLTWTTIGGGTGAAGDPVPTGSILMVDSGACPTGYAEDSTLAGRMPVGTLAANGDVGTTGGTDTLTPAGTINAQSFAGTLASLTHSGANVTSTFTGTALGTHAHELPWQIASTTTIRQIASGTFGTGTSRAATAVSAAGTANTTSAAVALSQAVSAGTPAGTVANTITQAGAHSYTPQGTVSAATFTGSSADNRSAFAKVLFCKKS